MKLYYDTAFREKIPVTNHGSDLVLNKEFIPWEENIVLALEDRAGNYYLYDEDKALIDKCELFINKFKRKIISDKVLVLVHPFYTSLSNMDVVSTKKSLDYLNKYTEKFISVLNARPDYEKLGILLLDTAHHFASTTSLFIENALVDDAFITQYDSGVLFDGFFPEKPITKIIDYINVNEKWMKLKDKDLFFCGGYNNRCLSIAMCEASKTIPEEKINAVSDLILNHPSDSEGIIPQKIYFKGKPLDSSKITTLDKLLKTI